MSPASEPGFLMEIDMRLVLLDLVAKALRITFQVNGVQFGRALTGRGDCSKASRWCQP
jgi:hypothetical protein